jgi:hypothetical protein
MTSGVEYAWRGPVSDHEVAALVADHGGDAEDGRWDQVRLHSLGWVSVLAIHTGACERRAARASIRSTTHPALGRAGQLSVRSSSVVTIEL